MISDVLSAAEQNIRNYLDDPVFAEAYSGELRTEIERVLADMAALREKLDQPPAHDTTHQ